MKNRKTLIIAIIIILIAMLAGVWYIADSNSQDTPLSSENEISSDLPVVKNNKIILANSANVTVKITDNIPSMNSSACYAYSLSEEELINGEDKVIFRGTVEKLDNILIDLDGQKEYRCILYINVNSSVSGDVQTNKTVSLLLPFPIAEGYHTSIGSVAEKIKIGTEGIFIAKVYDDESVYKAGDAVLYLNELAYCGLDDGERYLFIETADGLLYSESCYPSAYNANSLDDIEEYIKTVLK